MLPTPGITHWTILSDIMHSLFKRWAYWSSDTEHTILAKRGWIRIWIELDSFLHFKLLMLLLLTIIATTLIALLSSISQLYWTENWCIFSIVCTHKHASLHSLMERVPVTNMKKVVSYSKSWDWWAVKFLDLSSLAPETVNIMTWQSTSPQWLHLLPFP